MPSIRSFGQQRILCSIVNASTADKNDQINYQIQKEELEVSVEKLKKW